MMMRFEYTKGQMVVVEAPRILSTGEPLEVSLPKVIFDVHNNQSTYTPHSKSWPAVNDGLNRVRPDQRSGETSVDLHRKSNRAMLAEGSDPVLDDRMDILLKKFKTTLHKHPYHSGQVSMDQYYQPVSGSYRWDDQRNSYVDSQTGEELPIINQIEIVEQLAGVKSFDDQFKVSFQGNDYEIHPYRTPLVAGRKSLSATDAVKQIKKKIIKKLKRKDRQTVTVAVTGRNGVGKTTFTDTTEKVAIEKNFEADEILKINTDDFLTVLQNQIVVDVGHIMQKYNNALKKAKVVLVEGAYAHQLFNKPDAVGVPDIFKNPADIKVFIKNSDQRQLWDGIKTRENDYVSGAEHLLRAALIKNIENRYFGLDQEEETADIVIDTSMDRGRDRAILSPSRNLMDIINTQLTSKKIAGVPPKVAKRITQTEVQQEQYNDRFAKGHLSTDGNLEISYVSASPQARKEVARRIIGAVSPNATVLSIGPGPGDLEVELQERGLNVRGIDVSKTMAKIADLRGVSMVIGDAHKLPYADNSYDAIVFNESIGTTLLDLSLPEAFRVLKPGGKIIITTYAGDEIDQKKEAMGANYLNYSMFRRSYLR